MLLESGGQLEQLTPLNSVLSYESARQKQASMPTAPSALVEPYGHGAQE